MGPRDPGRGWQASATQMLINHLKGCSLQPDEIKQAAEAYSAQKTCSPYRRSSASSTFPQHQMGHRSVPGTSTFVSDQMAPLSLQTGTLFAPPASYSPAMSPMFLNTPSELPSPSSVPSPALSELALPTLTSWRRISRTSSRVMSRQSSVAPETLWSPSHQQRFKTRVARLTASANFSISWVENPEWLALLDEFIPSAISPTRKVLTNRIIPAEVQRIRHVSMNKTEGCEVTLQCDGWTGLNNHHYIAFMMTTGKQEVSGNAQTFIASLRSDFLCSFTQFVFMMRPMKARQQKIFLHLCRMLKQWSRRNGKLK